MKFTNERSHLLVTVETMAERVEQEREACAKLAEALGCDELARLIRARATK